MILNPSQSVNTLLNAGSPEVSRVTALVDDAVQEVTEFTLPAVAAATQADYFTFSRPNGDVIAVWLDIDANGTAPTGAAYVASDEQFEVDVITGDDASDVAGKVLAVLDGNVTGFSFSVDTDTLTVTSTVYGATANGAVHDEDDSGAGSVSVATTVAGADSTFGGKSFYVDGQDGSEYYVWLDDGVAADPAPGGKTGVAVSYVWGSSAATVAAAIAAAFSGNTDLVASASGAVVTIECDTPGVAVDASDEDSGYTISTAIQGIDSVLVEPGSLVGSLSNNP